MGYKEEDRGRCKTCGFLARKTIGWEERIQYHEMSEQERETGEGGTIAIDGRSVPILPACSVRAANISEEIDKFCPGQSNSTYRRSGTDRTAAMLSILNKARNCDRWYPYTPTFSPKEHLEEQRMIETETQRREFEERLERERREFDERLSARAESVELRLAGRNEELQWQRDQEQGRTAKLTTRITIVGVFIALAQVLTLTKDSVLWKLVARCYHWLTGR